MDEQFLYSVEYHDWNSDFSGFIDRQVLAVGISEEDAVQNAKRQAQSDSRDFKAEKIDAVMGMRISVAQPQERAHDADIGEDSRPDAVSGERLRTPVQAYIENARDDSIGGFTIPLPTTKEALQPWLDAIGAVGFHESDIAIREARSPMPELGSILRGFSDGELAFDELNFLAAKVGGMENWQAELFAAAVETGQHSGSVKALINLAENISHFDLEPAFSEGQYGSFLIQMEKDNSMDVFEKLEQSSDPDEQLFAQYVLRLEAHVDEAAYGHSVVQEEKGTFTSRGYLTDRGEFTEVYRGPQDIPPELRIFSAPTPAMDKDQFWRMIDDARERAGCWQDMRDPLVDTLAKLDAPDIIRWKQIFTEYQDLAYKDKLWAAAAVMQGGCSDDSFIDFRAWLIAQGKDTYLRALADPDSLADVKAVQDFARETRGSEYAPRDGYRESPSFESMNYAPVDAYESKTGGGNIYDSLYSSPLPVDETTAIAAEVSYALDIDAKWGGIGADWPSVDKELQRLLPRLHREFNRGEPQEKDSVIAKIREAQAAAKNSPPPVSEGPKHKKSHEPEV